MNCKNCKANCASRGKDQEVRCLGKLPMCNGDKVRVMSNEELKAWYCKGRDCGTCIFSHTVGCTMLEWLNQEAEPC